MEKIAQILNPIFRRLPTWPVYVGGVLPAAFYFYWAITNQLGVDPLQVLERQLGEWGLQLLILGLLVTPLRKFAGISLLKFRRAFGLLAFFYISLHLLIWIVLDKQFFWAEILRDLTKRPYIILGMLGFTLLIPLAITSNLVSLRRLGAKSWNRLHKLVYPAILLGAVHYLLVVKVWESEPMIYLGVVLILLFLRLPMVNRRKSRRVAA